MKPFGTAFRTLSVWARLALLIVLTILFTAIAIGLWIVCYGAGTDLSSLKMLQMCQTIAAFLLPPVVGTFLWSDAPCRWLHLDRSPRVVPSCIVVLLMLCAAPAVNMLADWNARLPLPDALGDWERLLREQEDAAALLAERFVQAHSLLQLCGNLFLVALLPALGEEFYFRGTLQHLFAEKTNPHAAVWACAALFSAVHFQFYGFFPRLLMGGLFGYMLLWSGSLWLPVIAHCVHNAFVVLLYNLYYMRGLEPDTDSFGTGDTLWAGLLSLLAVSVLLGLLRRSLTINNASSRKS